MLSIIEKNDIQGACSVNHHRSLEFIPGEKIPNGTTSNAEEGTASEPVNKSNDNHCLYILSHSTRYYPNQKEGKRNDIYRSTTIELKDLACIESNQGPQCHTSDNGPSNMGPMPRPMTKEDKPSVATSSEQWNSSVIWPYVDVYSEDVQVL